MLSALLAFDPWLDVHARGRRGHLPARLAAVASARSGALARLVGWRRFSADSPRSFWRSPRRSSRLRRCLLQVHMLQHLLLMMVAPPLVWLGWPLFPLVRGLPEPVPNSLGRAAAALAAAAAILFALLTHPLVAWPIVCRRRRGSGTRRAAMSWRSSRSDWHFVEHACFIASALLFWYPVVRPYPSRPRWSRVAAVSVFAAGRRAEHGAGGLADVFSGRALSALFARAAAGRDHRARRSGGGRRLDVGAGLDRVSAAAVLDRRVDVVRLG